MGRRDNRARFERIKSETEREVAAIKDAGGNINFIFEYHKFLSNLKSAEGSPLDAGVEKKFLRRPIQIAAVSAIKDMSSFASSGTPLNDEHSKRLSAAARSAYANAAGHFEDETLSGLPEPGLEATERRKRAAADWDRLVDSNPDKLVWISLFGQDAQTSTLTSTPSVGRIQSTVCLVLLIAALVGGTWLLSQLT